MTESTPEPTMEDGVCPKCGSDEIYTSDAGSPQSAMYLGLFRYSILHNYVCADCGYTEQWVEYRNDLEYIRQNWKRADGKKKKR